ncbi:RNA polymerase sigma factor (sigma-70 family) [Microbacterium sp. SORGH_AS 862]|nr:RNA polymerase sigma factor (sigma-70 family) [Microbacterium sp. SORGH_AS_0862]
MDTSISWLLRTARNLVGNEYQRRERESERLRRLMLEELTTAQSYSDHQNHIELWEAMARIRPVEALVLQLTYWYGLSATEGAQFLGCSTASFWQQMTRARAALRRELTLDGPGSASTAVHVGHVRHG